MGAFPWPLTFATATDLPPPPPIPPRPKVTTRRAAMKRPREHDSGHVIVGIGYAFDCSCGARGSNRRTWREAMQEGREHAAAHAQT